MQEKILDPLRKSSATAALFWEWCEFAQLKEDAPDWFALASGEPLQVIGRDACGGRFCLFPASNDYSGRLMYVDSEGSAGIIATSLSAGIQLMIALPYWRDCLKFSGGGDLDEMRKAQAQLEADLRQRGPDIDSCRETLYRTFALAEPSAPLETLHRDVVAGAQMKLIATSDGAEFGSLFNTFVVADNPMWSQQPGR